MTRRPPPVAPRGTVQGHRGAATRGLASLLLLAAMVLAPAPALGQEAAPPPSPEEVQGQRVLDLLGPLHVLREAWRETAEGFWDGSLREGGAGRVAWEAALERAAAGAQRARTSREVHQAANGMLAELRTSHLALLEGQVWERELRNEFRDEPRVRAGLEVAEVGSRLFVASVADAGPAAEVGLLVGDEVLLLDGLDPRRSPLLEPTGHDPGLGDPPSFCLRPVADGQGIRLLVRRAEGGEAAGLLVRPRLTSLIESTRDSVRVLHAPGGARVGYVHVWHLMHPRVFRTVREALRGSLSACEALVLDLRGRGGSAEVGLGILGLFTGRRPAWRRPAVALVDANTRSAKEILAWRWKDAGAGPLVGERTAGACLGCTFERLSDGSVLCLPVDDVRRLTRGEALEGRGVEPTVPAPQLPLPYRAGRDAILEAGLREAARLARAGGPY